MKYWVHQGGCQKAFTLKYISKKPIMVDNKYMYKVSAIVVVQNKLEN